ncbi:Maebl [Erysipelothrix larvae]|uniref:Maebl n=1 Tax=Erysipelothrix larvae TaxID=1514105 RepID=A0A0X8GYJ4_9FIRM|nr:NYN domain-containing protein [Erysipelothrix larvae]AMC92783.1 Maebl [Erysipelothrix larvae]
MKSTKEQHLAVLIDAENVPHANIAGILEEIARYGTPTIKRIYGDWTRQSASGWKQHLLENAITPIQQYAYTTGKNSSDSAMIIDAMDLLYEGNVERFCIISSDSDFTRLAVRLRESGRYVIGIGERKTPSAFIVACDKFIYMDLIEMKTPTQEQDLQVSKKKLSDLKHLVESSINDLADDNGYVFMGDLGNLLMKKRPDFDPRDYGFYQLTQLLKAMKLFDIDERRVENSNVKHVYIRNR